MEASRPLDALNSSRNKRVIVELKNGTQMIGTLRAFDIHINVVLEDSLYKKVQFLAQTDGVSLSTKVRELIKEAMDLQEDLYLASFAEERERTWDKLNTRIHNEIWS